MEKPKAGAIHENRRETPRVKLGETVTVSFVEGDMVGPGHNISTQGVFFVAEASIKVKVRVSGVERELDGELIRVQSMGEGRMGIAVRFAEPFDGLG